MITPSLWATVLLLCARRNLNITCSQREQYLAIKSVYTYLLKKLVIFSFSQHKYVKKNVYLCTKLENEQWTRCSINVELPLEYCLRTISSAVRKLSKVGKMLFRKGLCKYNMQMVAKESAEISLVNLLFLASNVFPFLLVAVKECVAFLHCLVLLILSHYFFLQLY